jgi:uncharacterized C2H2 Zn-finger protein
VVCPLCGLSVKHVEGESIHVTFDRHARGACDPSKHPEKKKRCPVRGCKEKLSAVNAFECKRCRVEVCLKHRHADAHFCGDRSRLRDGGAGAAAGAAASSAAERRKNANPWTLAKKANDFSARASRAPTSRAAAADYAPLPANRLVSGSGVHANLREVCAQCGRSFPHLAALIAHAEAEHASGASVRGDGGGGRETCPRCGARFSDVAALVDHVERAHEQNPKRKSASQCRVS